jgi:hypothetical protein
MSMKNANDTIGNRTRDLPACRAVPEPTAPPRVSIYKYKSTVNGNKKEKLLTGNFILILI